MKRLSYICLLIMSAVSCRKEVLEVKGGSLGTKTVEAAEGSFSMFVQTDGVWQVSSPQDWIHLPSGMFKDNSSVLVSYDSNESADGVLKFNRLGHVVVKTADGAAADTLYVRQRGIEPFISFTGDYSAPSAGGYCSVPVLTNLGGSQRPGISLSADASWMSDIAFEKDCAGVGFTVQAGSGRNASLTFSFTDEWGVTTNASCKINQ
ncbi:MAG: BACON domain-containing protein [Bacteroidales bacterium]|nr:BACON domain-containing protein [Bacteroidales bacterium]